MPLLLIAALLLSGCDVFGDSSDDTSVVCPAVLKPAVEVEIRNAETNAPEAEDVFGRVIDGSFVDTMRVSQTTEYQGAQVPLSLSGADERPGTYEVILEKDGFQRWTRSGLEPDVGECGVETLTIEADLIPTSGS